MQPTPQTVRITSPVDGISGTTLYSAIDGAAGASPAPGPRVAVIARMHGNEPVGDPVLDRLAVLAPRHLVRGSLLAVRANEVAAAIGARHSAGGSDLNRMWDASTHARLASQPLASLSYEEPRSLELFPLLMACDAVLDLHSTSRPAAPFLVMRDDQDHARIARRLGVERLITGLHENAILSGGVSANVGLHPAERGPRLGFTFEAGQHTDPENGLRAWDVTERLLAELGIWDREPSQATGRSEVYEVTERFRQASAGAAPYRFVGYEGGEAGGGRHGLPARQLHSFEELQADEVVLRRGRSEVVRARSPFTMLMPAPATPPGTDLYYVAQPRRGGLANGVPRTDEQARIEATAIERMLDLMADDEFERGSTWVAFDARRLFDLCASVVGRTLRLDRDDPHRRIVVMGRGDVGGVEAERRAGHRYRDAMRAAIADGMPIERIQLLRGAPLAWLDALTGHGMLAQLEQRRRNQPDGPPVRMRLSLRQPHTASLLVTGDPELALRTGDTRHVRVALLVEAATVEPDGASARVRVVRAGLVSTRREVLTAASNLLSTLRREHSSLVHLGMNEDPAIARLLLPDDALEAVADAEALAALRASLYRVQLRLWSDQLRTELPEPVPLATEAEVGGWLARTMAATGILDPVALHRLVVRPATNATGWVADPAAVQEVYDEVHREVESPPPLVAVGTVPIPTPPQPLFASELCADDLERWVSWKRFVRGVEVVPDTRGKDLDLVFRGAEIRDRLIRWYAEARARAAERPGEVKVVIAGDGLNPTRDQLGDAFELYRAHRALVLDPNLHFLRIQHAQGTHLSWMKDLLLTLALRPPGSQPMSLQFEVEHGASVSVILVLERDTDSPVRSWSLDGWEVTHSAVILSDLEARGANDYKVGLFTEGGLGRSGNANYELLHFGRAHCEGLLSQGGTRVGGVGAVTTDRLEEALVVQISRWIERARVWRRSSQTTPSDPDERGVWVAQRLGLSDGRLARAIGVQMETGTPALRAARELWAHEPIWPGAGFPALDGPVGPAPSGPGEGRFGSSGGLSSVGGNGDA
jgi:predicted deacylase